MSTPISTPDLLAYDEGPTIIGLCAAMMPCSAVVVALRLWARRRMKMPLEWDDWLIVMSLPLLWSVAILGIAAVCYGGVGRHLNAVLAEDPAIFGRSMLDNVSRNVSYGTVLYTVKASVLLMYYRIFPTTGMKVGGYVLGGLTLAWWLAVVLVSTFQCTPVHKAWNPLMEGGKCLDTNKFFLGNSIPSIITDALILCLPVLEVSKLQVRRSQKVAIGGMFLLGGLVVVISCIRLKVVIDLSNAGADADFTQLIGPCWIWTTIEPTIAMLCASLPTMRPLMHFLFGRFIGGSSDGKNNVTGLVTIGGTGSNQSAKGKGQKSGRSFKRLDDNDSADEPVLWPEGYVNDQTTIAERSQTLGSCDEDIPLDAIKVQKGITWTESRKM
ncbi:satratoxin biosynthesis SC1 cluster protein 4 [Colletotrichum asianum]|uniref:Satratoxin biosynthesis SC1 cluster protein 4 n=1 Tax=Colletotrichum asianum TaxID=702518 RepID=A0A8H3WAQ9_9PEZI|nr:satratoxin biosynthesis SC1 cluster protein 4 [Colletotrichum asianum]